MNSKLKTILKPIYLPIHFFLFGLVYGIKDCFSPTKPIKRAKVEIDQKQIKIWMVGHATILINFFGTTILTDPVFVNWIPFPKRHLAPGLEIDDLPAIDYIILSHAHFDHLNLKSLKRLENKTKTLILPKNCHDLVKDLNFPNKVSLDWNQTRQFDGLEVFTYKPVHWGERYPWQRKNRGFNSYVLKKNNFEIFFCGDSGYGNFFKNIAKKHSIDLAFLGIGAYKPYDFLRFSHLNPKDAVRAFFDLKAKKFIPIHWGNFRLSLEPMSEPVKQLEKLIKINNLIKSVHILENGENYILV